MSDERLSELLENYFQREITAAEKTELQGILLTRTAARERFWAEAEWHALYHQWGEQETGRLAAARLAPPAAAPVARSVSTASRKNPAKASPNRRKWAAGIATLVSVLILAVVFGPGIADRPVATLDRSSGATWGPKRSALKAGTKLKPGLLRVDQGHAVIAFHRGARLVLEGPAELEIVSDNTATLRSGKLHALLSNRANGFKLTAPQYTVMDTGTEFGCTVAADGTGEVHVLGGSVIVGTPSANQAGKSLKVNQAIRVDYANLAIIPVRRTDFVSEAELKRRELLRKGDRFGAWQIAAQALNADPSAVVHFEFEEGGNQSMPNSAVKAPPQSDGKRVGGQATTGRWPNKRALAFVQPGDRIEVPLHTTSESITFFAWIRAEDVSSRQYLAKAVGKPQVGHVDWYIYQDGTLGLGVHAQLAADPNRGWYWIHSQGRLPKGGWICVASVLDAAAARITHYMDGKPIGEGPLENRVPLRFDSVNLAGFSQAGPGFQFRGGMDEFAMLTRALTAGEIQQMYERGKPERK